MFGVAGCGLNLNRIDFKPTARNPKRVVQQAVRQAHGHEQGRRTHGPERGRRAIRNFLNG